MTISQKQQKNAVDSGYWHLYRFNPALKQDGKNPFSLDSKEPVGDYAEFLQSEVRYAVLLQKYGPEKVVEILAKAIQDSKDRYASYKRLAETEIV
jgi:pyruvate-ferredoxin/flavodoxin oxidoreductase